MYFILKTLSIQNIKNELTVEFEVWEAYEKIYPDMDF